MENDTKKCPYCGKEIKAVAKKCRYCGNWLTEREDSEKKTKKAQKHNSKLIPVIGIVIVLVLLIGGVWIFTSNKSSESTNTEEVEKSEGYNVSIEQYLKWHDLTSEEIQADAKKKKFEYLSERTKNEFLNDLSSNPDEYVGMFTLNNNVFVFISRDNGDEGKGPAYFLCATDPLIVSIWKEQLNSMGYNKTVNLLGINYTYRKNNPYPLLQITETPSGNGMFIYVAPSVFDNAIHFTD